jgi:hypothetical protein
VKKQLEIPEAVLKRWWWRRLVFVKFDEETHTTQWKQYVPEHPSYGFSMEWNMWHRKDELEAFRFELLRRLFFTDLPEWIYLPAWLGSWTSGILAPKPQRSVCGLFAPPKPNYVSFDWMWDLEASDESLCEHFIMFMNEERQKRNLPTSDVIGRIIGKQLKHGDKRRGERNRQVSWLAVEAHDVKLHKVRPLTDGERSRLSKAIREMAAFESPLREALEMANKHKPQNHQNSPQEHLQARFVRENFLERFASRIQRG